MSANWVICAESGCFTGGLGIAAMCAADTPSLDRNCTGGALHQ
jgi:hypothetical protein